MKTLKHLACLCLSISMFSLPLNAQYFGQNKPKYEQFDFEVLESPTFELHHYLKNQKCAHDFANQSEQWYHMHQEILKDTFTRKNPIVLYNNHPDFQQTNTIFSSVSVGTGGVTEALKNRVVMPIALSNQQTNHVLGHELVHAFQYHMILTGDSTSLKSLSNLPLWMVEGLAEYMSIGSLDPHTAMWMRDAVVNENVPSIKKLSDPTFFPYRYGQAFWSFLTGMYGDGVIEPFFMETAKHGMEIASERILGMELKALSELWENSLKEQYAPFVGDKKEKKFGRVLVSKENSGKMNIAPVLSPNGRYMIFLTEKNIFSMDLFLADARTGQIMRKVGSTLKDGHLDDFNYIESAGTWSPNSEKFAFVAVDEGNNVLVVKEALTGKTLETFSVPEVPAFGNPTWSPDGKSIVVAGLVDGQVDLYQISVKTKKVKQLTDDIYAELLPSWSADGSQIVFATDKLSMEEGRVHGKWTHNIAMLNVEDGSIQHFDFFKGADNLNPVFDIDGNVLFLSNRDGFRNMYKLTPESGEVFQLTNYLTGISGITPYAPAISTSTRAKRNRVLFMHYYGNSYSINTAKPEDFLNQAIQSDAVDMAAARLPGGHFSNAKKVDQNLSKMDEYEPVADSSLVATAYEPRFKLDHASGTTGAGVSTGGGLGAATGLAGGVNLLFGDMLGDNQLFTTIAMNGDVYDFGGQVTYLNRKNRINWGLSLSHIPYQIGGLFSYQGVKTLTFNNGSEVDADHFTLDNMRYFEEKVGAFAQFPFSKHLRLEAGGAFAFYSNRVDRFDLYYDAFGRLIARDRSRIAPEEIGVNLFRGELGNASIALVGDNTHFGVTAPLAGHRFRFGVDRSFGSVNFYSVTADYRRYVYMKPFSLAFRTAHFGRYGETSSLFFPYYLGQPWYVRGYGYNQADGVLGPNGRSVDELFGSKIGVANLELRLPFTGPEQLAVLKSKFFLSDLNLFVDGGIAFNSLNEFQQSGDGTVATPKPVFSTGVSMRVNLFGAMILEPYYAIPIQQETKGIFGINIVPGW